MDPAPPAASAGGAVRPRAPKARKRKDMPAARSQWSSYEYLREVGLPELGELASQITAAPDFDGDSAREIVERAYRAPDPTQGGSRHGFADSSYQIAAINDVQALHRDGNVLVVNSDAVSILLSNALHSNPPHTPDKIISNDLCNGFLGPIHRTITRDDFPLSSRAVPLPYRAIAFLLPEKDWIFPDGLTEFGEPKPPPGGIDPTHHFAVLIYYIHHHEVLDKSVLDELAADPALQGSPTPTATQRHAFTNRFRNAPAASPLRPSLRPRLYYYDSLGTTNYRIAGLLSEVLCVYLKLFDANCNSSADYDLITVTPRRALQKAASCATWSITFAQKAAQSSMRRNYDPVPTEATQQMTDVCVRSALDIFYERFTKLALWYDGALNEHAMRGAAYTRAMIDQRVRNILAPASPAANNPTRIAGLVDYLQSLYFGPDTINSRELFGKRPWNEATNADFVRLYLSTDLSVPADVVFVTTHAALAAAWAATIEKFRSALTDADLPRLFMWLYLPDDDAAVGGGGAAAAAAGEHAGLPSAPTRPFLMSFRPVYSLLLGTMRAPHIFVQMRLDPSEDQEPYRAFADAVIERFLGDHEPQERVLVPSLLLTAYSRVLRGDTYISLIQIAREAARTDAYVVPGWVAPRAMLVSGFMNEKERAARGLVPGSREDMYQREYRSIRRSMYGRVMELLALQGEDISANARLPEPGRLGRIDLDARSLVQTYDEVSPPIDGVTFAPSRVGQMRARWAFQYFNIPLYSAVRAALLQLGPAPGNRVKEPLDRILAAPCCTRYVDSVEHSICVVFEQWITLVQHASVVDRPRFDAWLASFQVTKAMQDAVDPSPLMQMRVHSARLAQFPVVVHGPTIGISDARPVVFGIAEVLTALYMDQAFGVWLKARIVSENDTYSYPNAMARIISGPDMHHLDPYIHIVVENFGAQRLRLAGRLQNLRTIADVVAPTPVSIEDSNSGDQPDPRAILMMGSFSNAALMLASYLIAG